jgi:hypothetical protein
MVAAGGDGIRLDGCVTLTTIEDGVVTSDTVTEMSGFMVVPRNCYPIQDKPVSRDYPARRTKFVGLKVVARL